MGIPYINHRDSIAYTRICRKGKQVNKKGGIDMKLAGIIILCIGVLSLVGQAIGSVGGISIWSFVLPAIGLGLLIGGITKERKK